MRINPRLIENEYVSIKQCRHGLFAYNVNDTYIGRSLDVYGEWAEGEVDLLSQVLSPGDVVVDVGANIGTHTVALARKVTPGGGVFAFEPQPLAFQLLCANAALNAFHHVRCHNVAVADEPRTVIIPVLDPSQIANFGAFRVDGHDSGEPVPAIRLDDVGLPHCKLIKIDTEGMEAQVLRGARQLIANFRPVLFVENSVEDQSRDLLALLDELGYACWWHIAEYYSPANFFENDENVFPDLVPETNLFCVHKDIPLTGCTLWPVEGFDDSFLKVMARHGRDVRLIRPDGSGTKV